MQTFRPFIIFVAITFAITWGLALLFWAAIATGLLSGKSLGWWVLPFLVLGAWAPNIAGVAAAYMTQGHDGVRDLFDRLTRWRIDWFWWAAAFLLPFLLWNLAILGAMPFADVSFARWIPASGTAFLMFLGAHLIGGPLAEELGWRGFALPRLLSRMGAVPASLLIGAVWALWHLPVFFIPELERIILPPGLAFLPFAIYVVSASVLMSWITLSARQSVLPAMAFHFMLLFGLIAVDKNPLPALVWAGVVCFTAAAVVLVIRTPDLGAHRLGDRIARSTDGSGGEIMQRGSGR